MSRNPDSPLFEALVIPSEALEKGGVEVLRASIVGGELHVTLRPTFEEPRHWGDLLTELVRRIAKAYAAAGPIPEEHAVLSIRTAFIGVDEVAVRPKRAAKSKKPAKKSKKKGARR